MEKIKRIVIIGVLISVLVINSHDISSLRNAPGWNDGDYLSVFDVDVCK